MGVPLAGHHHEMLLLLCHLFTCSLTPGARFDTGYGIGSVPVRLFLYLLSQYRTHVRLWRGNSDTRAIDWTVHGSLDSHRGGGCLAFLCIREPLLHTFHLLVLLTSCVYRLGSAVAFLRARFDRLIPAYVPFVGLELSLCSLDTIVVVLLFDFLYAF